MIKPITKVAAFEFLTNNYTSLLGVSKKTPTEQRLVDIYNQLYRDLYDNRALIEVRKGEKHGNNVRFTGGSTVTLDKNTTAYITCLGKLLVLEKKYFDEFDGKNQYTYLVYTIIEDEFAKRKIIAI